MKTVSSRLDKGSRYRPLKAGRADEKSLCESERLKNRGGFSGENGGEFALLEREFALTSSKLSRKYKNRKYKK
jgi:hypothetical protein